MSTPRKALESKYEHCTRQIGFFKKTQLARKGEFKHGKKGQALLFFVCIELHATNSESKLFIQIEVNKITNRISRNCII